MSRGSRIEEIKALQIFDSRGRPTLQVNVTTNRGVFRSWVPSINGYRAWERRDDDDSISLAVNKINQDFGRRMTWADLRVTRQREIDEYLQIVDGTTDRSNLGVIVMIGISVACCKAGTAHKQIPLHQYIRELTKTEGVERPCTMSVYNIPIPRFNMISGGRHANNKLTCQEFAILPTGAENFADAVMMAVKVYRVLERKIIEKLQIQPPFDKYPLLVSDEGAFVPDLENDEAAIALLKESITEAGYNDKIKIALDMAASAFYTEVLGFWRYDLAFKKSDPNYLNYNSLKNRYIQYMTNYLPLVSIEDPFDRRDEAGWQNFTDQMQRIQVVCDDLNWAAMNNEIFERTMNSANCFVLRILQISTVTEVIDYANMAKDKGWAYIVSASQGDTEDTFIADMAFALQANQFSAGAPCRGERIAKYNKMINLEKELERRANYDGNRFR